MLSIRNVFNAFTNLAASVNALAGVIDAATARLRLQFAAEVDPPALPHDGEVIDHAEPSPSASTKRSRKPA